MLSNEQPNEKHIQPQACLEKNLTGTKKRQPSLLHSPVVDSILNQNVNLVASDLILKLEVGDDQVQLVILYPG